MRTVRKKDDKGNFCLAFRQKSADCLILYLSINCYFTKKLKINFQPVYCLSHSHYMYLLPYANKQYELFLRMTMSTMWTSAMMILR